MIKVIFINIQSKIKMNDLVSDTLNPHVRSSPGLMLMYIIAAEVLANFIDKD